MSELISVIVVDDEQRSLNRMKILLQNFNYVEILVMIDGSKTALDIILKKKPDIVFMDVEMPGISGLELAEEINKRSLGTRIVFVSAYEHYAISAIRQYAFDYLLKPVNIEDLKSTLERYKSKVQTNLSKREFEIIRLIGKGLNSKAIGEQLFLSRHTVDTHRRTILDKTGCSNSAELISYAAKNNLI